MAEIKLGNRSSLPLKMVKKFSDFEKTTRDDSGHFMKNEIQADSNKNSSNLPVMGTSTNSDISPIKFSPAL